MIELSNIEGEEQEEWNNALEIAYHEITTMLMPMLDKNKLKRH